MPGPAPQPARQRVRRPRRVHEIYVVQAAGVGLLLLYAVAVALASLLAPFRLAAGGAPFVLGHLVFAAAIMAVGVMAFELGHYAAFLVTSTASGAMITAP